MRRFCGSRASRRTPPTNNFKLDSRHYLDSMTLESTAAFELAFEL
jgi:hypothetical protein